MSLQILRNELLTDPIPLGYAGKTDQQCLDLLSAKTRSRLKPLTTTDLLRWSGAGQRYLALKNASNVTADSQTKNLATVFLVLIDSPGIPFDLNTSDFKNMIDALVTANVLTAADRTALNTMATEPINRFAELNIPEYQLGDVIRARTGTA
jgi:hypothetical protein